MFHLNPHNVQIFMVACSDFDPTPRRNESQPSLQKPLTIHCASRRARHRAVWALPFLIHVKMELNSMKNHFKIDPNIYCCFIDTVGSLGVPETCLGGSGAISGRTWAPRGRPLRFSRKFQGNFGIHVELILIAFSLLCCGLFFDGFLDRCCIDVGTILGVLFKGLFGTFPTSNKNAAPHESGANIS